MTEHERLPNVKTIALTDSHNQTQKPTVISTQLDWRSMSNGSGVKWSRSATNVCTRCRKLAICLVDDPVVNFIQRPLGYEFPQKWILLATTYQTTRNTL